MGWARRPAAADRGTLNGLAGIMRFPPAQKRDRRITFS